MRPSAWEDMKSVGEGDLLTVADVCDIVPGYGAPLSKGTVYSWIREGINGLKLPARRLGRIYLIHRADLASFLIETTSRTAEPEAKAAAAEAEAEAFKEASCA